MEIFNFIAGLSSIISLILTFFIATKVYNINITGIKKSFFSGNKTIKVSKSENEGDIFIGTKK